MTRRLVKENNVIGHSQYIFTVPYVILFDPSTFLSALCYFSSTTPIALFYIFHIYITFKLRFHLGQPCGANSCVRDCVTLYL